MDNISISISNNKIKKIDLIKGFIKKYKPTRSQLTRFIIVNVNGLCVDNEFKFVNYRGYYSANLLKMREVGNVEIKNGRYQLTKQAYQHKYSLYHEPNWRKVERLKKEVKRLNGYNINYRTQIHELYKELKECKNKHTIFVDDIRSLCNHNLNGN